MVVLEGCQVLRGHSGSFPCVPGTILRRAAGFLSKRFGSALTAQHAPEGTRLLDGLMSQSREVQRLYEEREYGKALREVMLLADRVNEYVDQNDQGV